jgi:hypothetical protein
MGLYFDGDGTKFRKEANADPKRVVVTPQGTELDRLAAKFRPFHDEWIKEQPGREAKYKALTEILASLRGSSS